MTQTIEVRGFHCTGCADNLGRALRSLEGVIRADADYEQGRVEVRFDAERVTDDDIRERIQASGFDTGGSE
ncbi:MAG: heavy-metal-associated domain-containing protein [Actinomycetota bacterium]|nr:heavy-metal-associated domain-containing protein [Actinomycetota bacterium]